VEGYLTEEEPGPGRSKKDLSMSPLAVVVPEIGPASLGGIEALARVLEDSGTADFVRLALTLAKAVGLDILHGFLRVAGNIESVPRSFGDGKTEVKSNASRDSTKPDNDTPHLVDGKLADTIAKVNRLGSLERVVEAGHDNESNNGSCELANALHGKDSTHHRSSPLGRGESGSGISRAERSESQASLLRSDD
jgi:hypothetical protein